MRYLVFSLLILLVSCGGDNNDEELDVATFAAKEALKRGFESVPSMDSATLSDFNFLDAPDYAEVRLHYIGESPDTFDVQKELDPETKSSLTETQLFNLNSTNSEVGYEGGCIPSSCYYYMVALKGELTTLIDTVTGLKNFLDGIDTPAELHFALGNLGTPVFYEKTDNGYSVLTIQHGCGTNRVELYKVTQEGDAFLQELLYEHYTGMVC